MARRPHAAALLALLALVLPALLAAGQGTNNAANTKLVCDREFPLCLGGGMW